MVKKNYTVRSFLLTSIIVLTSTFTTNTEAVENSLDQNTFLEQKSLKLSYPYEVNDGAEFKFRFDALPQASKILNVDIDFDSKVPDLNKILSGIKNGDLVYATDDVVWAFDYDTEIQTMFALLDFQLGCKLLNGSYTYSPNYTFFRLINGFRSYDFKSGGGLSISEWIAARSLKAENIKFEGQNRISYLIPSNCANLLLQVSAKLHVGYSGAWFYQYNGVRYKPTSTNVRPPVRENRWPEYSIYTIAKVATSKATSTPKPTSKTQSTTTPASSETKSSSIKEGSSCSTAGKLISSGKTKFVCGKIANKLIWIEIKGGSDTTDAEKSSPTPSTKTKICSTESKNIRSYVGSDNKTEPGFPLTALIFENLSDCNLSVSATASFLCPDGGALKLTNSIRSTGSFPIGPKQKLTISIQINKYFPQAIQQCFLLTGYRPNVVQIDSYHNNAITTLILSSTP